MVLKVKCLLLVLSFTMAEFAWSWGKVGHEAIALIATKNLSATAKIKLKSLIDSDDLREPSIWPDVIRNQPAWGHSKPFHFTSVKDGSSYIESLEESTLEERILGDAIRAMVKAEDVLRSSKSSQEEKTYALKFLVHLVGDIHQPLHTGRPEDKGGNQVSMNWFGRKDNLHSVWDTGIIRVGMEGAPAWSPELAESAEFYVTLLPKPSALRIQQWKTASYLEWHDDSLAQRKHPYQSVNLANPEIVKTYKNLVDEKVLMAGHRLAFLLNMIFENRPINNQGKILRNQLVRTLGADHGNEIFLIPLGQNQNTKLNYSHYECSH